MEIKKFVLSDFAVNSFLLIKKNEAILVDVGFEPNPIEEYIMKNNIELKAIFLTHGHLDHIGGLEYIRSKFNAPVYIHNNENEWLINPKLNGSYDFPFYGEVKCKPAEHPIIEEKLIKVSNFEIQIIHTPGHTPGGISYYIKPFLFSGDTLFNNSVGRTDLFGGNHQQLIESIKSRLFTLPDDTVVYPGHGEKTSIKNEKRSNPFI